MHILSASTMQTQFFKPPSLKGILRSNKLSIIRQQPQNKSNKRKKKKQQKNYLLANKLNSKFTNVLRFMLSLCQTKTIIVLCHHQQQQTAINRIKNEWWYRKCCIGKFIVLNNIKHHWLLVRFISPTIDVGNNFYTLSWSQCWQYFPQIVHLMNFKCKSLD